jgi:hypothetical protein
VEAQREGRNPKTEILKEAEVRIPAEPLPKVRIDRIMKGQNYEPNGIGWNFILWFP